jgi:hypothetical protein
MTHRGARQRHGCSGSRLIVNGHRRKGRDAAALARIAGRRLIEADDVARLEEQIDASRKTRTTLAAIATLKPRSGCRPSRKTLPN